MENLALNCLLITNVPHGTMSGFSSTHFKISGNIHIHMYYTYLTSMESVVGIFSPKD